MHSSTFNSRYLLFWSLKFLTCLILFFVIAEWLMPRFLPTEKWDYVQREAHEIEALALGDSTGVALRFDQLGQKGLSLPSPSVPVPIELLRARIALKKLPAIHTVYYQFTAHTFQNRLDPDRDYLEDMPLDRDALTEAPALTLQAFSHYLKSSLKWRHRWNRKNGDRWIRERKVYLGELEENTATWADMESELVEWRRQEARFPRNIDEETRHNRELIKAFADELALQGIRFVLVLFPESPVFVKHWPELYTYHDRLTSLGEHPHIELIDLSSVCDDLPHGAPNVYFHDMVHLNPTGAAKYTAELHSRLNPANTTPPATEQKG